MIELNLVRHGETDWNKYKLTQGKSDIPLNDIGRNQAAQLKNKINLDDIDICFVSTLKRAKETAMILLEGSNIKVIYDERLIERDFGNFEKKVVNPVIAHKLWNQNDIYDASNVETLTECLERAKLFLEYLKENYDNKKVLIVSHACLIKCMHFIINGYDENTDFYKFHPDNGKVLKYTL